MTRPFNFNINAAELFTEVNSMTNKQRGEFILQLSTDFLTLVPRSDFARQVIENTLAIIEKRRESGKLGGRPKSEGLAEVKQGLSEGKAKPKQSLSNKENKKNKEKEEEKTQNIPLPEWLPIEEWNAFIQHRHEMKKPMSELSQKMMLKKLTDNRTVYDPAKALRRAIANTWQDIYFDDSCKITTTTECVTPPWL